MARAVTTQHGNRVFVEVPPAELNRLPEEFLLFLNKRIGDPWPATRFVLDYLQDFPIVVYVRGERNAAAANTEWYVQLTFSGCAGMAEISAMAAWHWAHIWFTDNRVDLAERRLVPYGFTPFQEQAQEGNDVALLPTPDRGYALFSPCIESDDAESARLFDIDAAFTEALPDNGEAYLADLRANHGALMSDGRCRCQICSPGFDPSVVRVSSP
ncbi:MAG: hypothetical protein IT443_11755 [Phycisphaeraceae bacterium]|nr:hypothetical protein [Phycisphaeraceae bacterium]